MYQHKEIEMKKKCGCIKGENNATVTRSWKDMKIRIEDSVIENETCTMLKRS